MLRQSLILGALTLLGAVLVHCIHPSAPAWYAAEETALPEGSVSVQQILGKWQGDVLWLDARSQEQYEKEHISGAVLLNEQHFDQQLFDIIERLQSNTKPVVIYCDAQKCEASKKIRSTLMQRVGLQNVWVLHGGWPAWKGR